MFVSFGGVLVVRGLIFYFRRPTPPLILLFVALGIAFCVLRALMSPRFLFRFIVLTLFCIFLSFPLTFRFT